MSRDNAAVASPTSPPRSNLPGTSISMKPNDGAPPAITKPQQVRFHCPTGLLPRPLKLPPERRENTRVSFHCLSDPSFIGPSELRHVSDCQSGSGRLDKRISSCCRHEGSIYGRRCTDFRRADALNVSDCGDWATVSKTTETMLFPSRNVLAGTGTTSSFQNGSFRTGTSILDPICSSLTDTSKLCGATHSGIWRVNIISMPLLRSGPGVTRKATWWPLIQEDSSSGR